MKELMKGNKATALGAKLARVNVVPAYPITPSTLFPEQISEYIANGELDAEIILVESEHSAMSACIGASASGARTCTATASQGLELMHEMLFIASGMRLPIVMAVGNRAVAAPINIWCDHQDTISARDCGWMQFYSESSQEALDFMIISFKVAERKEILTPSMVGLDAFILTHTVEPVDVPDQKLVDEFVPPYKPEHVALDPKNPMTVGSFGTPEFYMEFRYAQEKAMQRCPAAIDEAFSEFADKFGRKYQRVSGYKTEDADVILTAMGSMVGTARTTVDKLREAGHKVGLLKLTVMRPFPAKEILEIIKNAKAVAVCDRNVSIGLSGALFPEIASILVNRDDDGPKLKNYVLGLGGRDVTIDDFEYIAADAEKIADSGKVDEPVKWVNVKEVE